MVRQLDEGTRPFTRSTTRPNFLAKREECVRQLGELSIMRHGPRCPATIATALLLATLDVFSWTSDGPSYRYVIAILWLALAFAIDGSLAGDRRRLHIGVVFAIYLFGLWVAGVFTYAILTKHWAADSFVVLAGVIAIVIAPVAYYALPARPGWHLPASRFFQWATYCFAGAALVDGILTPAGSQPILLGHEKAYLAVVALAAPRFSGVIAMKTTVVIALIVAFLKYPSATVAFVGLVAGICVWLLSAKTRGSLVLRTGGLVLCFAIISYNASRWVSQFYSATGRVDNTSTRLGLWDQALATIAKSPITGAAASERITGLANIRGIIQPVPFHNSFLTLAFCAGIVAVVLFGLLLSAALLACLSSSPRELRGALIWMPALFAGVITMSVNPVLERLGTALPLYALILCSAPYLASGAGSRKISKGVRR